MSEVKTPEQQEIEVQEPTTEPTQEPKKSTDEKIAEAIAQVTEGFKKELSGLNRKNSELEKEKNDLLKSQMSDEAKRQVELDEYKQQADELKRFKRERLVETTLVNAGLPADFAKSINFNGESDYEIESSVKLFAENYLSNVKQSSEKEIKDKLGGKGPERTSTPEAGEMKREEFENLPPDKKMEVIKKGVKLT